MELAVARSSFLMAALRYYKAGFVDFKAPGFLAAGFFMGASIGAIGSNPYECRVTAKSLQSLFVSRLFT